MEIETIKEISTDMIDDPPHAMRTEINRDELWELAENIKQNGLINPITVRPVKNRYEVVAGHRRLSACKIIGKIKIQCVVRELDDNKVFEIMASENLERKDVNPVEEAIFISNFMKQTNKNVQEIAKSLRRSVSYIESRLAISTMPEYLQNYLQSGKIKLGVALCLNKITVERTRHVWVDMAARDGVSVAQAEYWLHGFEMSLLPGGVLSDEPPADFESGVTPVVMFECAIDGKKYDARLFRSVMIYEQNLDFFHEVVASIRATVPNESI